jgi:hypothetical protein
MMRHSIAIFVACLVSSVSLSAQGPRGTLIVSNMNDNTATILDAASGRGWHHPPAKGREVAASPGGHWAIVSSYGIQESRATASPSSTWRVTRSCARSTCTVSTAHGMASLPGDSVVGHRARKQGGGSRRL